MGAKEVSHVTIGLKGQPEAGLGGDPFEESENGRGWQREGVGKNERGHMEWLQSRENLPEGRAPGVLGRVLNGLGDGRDNRVLMISRARETWRKPGAGSRPAAAVRREEGIYGSRDWARLP